MEPTSLFENLASIPIFALRRNSESNQIIATRKWMRVSSLVACMEPTSLFENLASIPIFALRRNLESNQIIATRKWMRVANAQQLSR
jgi:hypothetical protein